MGPATAKPKVCPSIARFAAERHKMAGMVNYLIFPLQNQMLVLLSEDQILEGSCQSSSAAALKRFAHLLN